MRAAHPIVARVAHIRRQLRFVFRHFPLTNSHPHAQRAAEAAEWAARTGPSGRCTTRCTRAQKSLSDRQILELRAPGWASRPPLLERAWAEHTYIPRVKEDFPGGIESGVDRTPAFFINGVRHEGGWD